MPYIEKLYIEIERLNKLLDELEYTYRSECRPEAFTEYSGKLHTIQAIRQKVFTEAEKVMLNPEDKYSLVERIAKWRR